MREDDRQRVTEFVKELYAVGEIDADRLNNGVAGVLAASSEAELAAVVRSLPAPVALTSKERRLAEPLEIHSGLGRLRLAGKWQVARETHVSADLGSVPGVGVQLIRHRGGVDSRLDPPIPGLPLIRLDVTTNIGRVHLRHPQPKARPSRKKRR
jgi:DUF1707 SHOCT-like domain